MKVQVLAFMVAVSLTWNTQAQSQNTKAKAAPTPAPKQTPAPAKLPAFDYNKNTKQGENPAVHSKALPAEPPRKEYVSHPQSMTGGVTPVKGGASGSVTIPIGKPKPTPTK